TFAGPSACCPHCPSTRSRETGRRPGRVATSTGPRTRTRTTEEKMHQRRESLHQGLHQIGANRGSPGQNLTREEGGRPPQGGRPQRSQVEVLRKERTRCQFLTAGPLCRGDWIRTSDLLNPINAVYARKSPENGTVPRFTPSRVYRDCSIFQGQQQIL